MGGSSSLVNGDPVVHLALHSQTIRLVLLRNIMYDGGRPLEVGVSPIPSIYFRRVDGGEFPLVSALQGRHDPPMDLV